MSVGVLGNAANLTVYQEQWPSVPPSSIVFWMCGASGSCPLDMYGCGAQALA